jgi:hypothetical protein
VTVTGVRLPKRSTGAKSYSKRFVGDAADGGRGGEHMCGFVVYGVLLHDDGGRVCDGFPLHLERQAEPAGEHGPCDCEPRSLGRPSQSGQW